MLTSNNIKSLPPCGVVGGMGIYASIRFVNELYAKFVGVDDFEKPRLLLDVNTAIPGRADFFLNGQESPIGELSKSVRELESHGVNLIAIPCNSASILISEIAASSDTEILNIIEVVKTAMRSECINKRVLILGGRVTLRLKTYSQILVDLNSLEIQISSEEESELINLINYIKSNGYTSDSESHLQKFFTKLICKYKPEVIVLACTELFEPNGFPELKWIDSRSELASEMYRRLKEI